MTDKMSLWEPDLPAQPGPAGREEYGHIAFERLPNTRDLGGLVGAGGRRVRSGMLLRSGALGFGSVADIARLRDEYRLRSVVDLRTEDEVVERPDPMGELPDARYLNVSIISEETMGITQDEDSRLRARELSGSDPDGFRVLLAQLYPGFLLARSGIEGYRALVGELLAGVDGAILWHCSVGRDRCGLGSLLVETVLGVSTEDAKADYLATNIFAPPSEEIGPGASELAFELTLDAVEREYGGLMGYVEEALGVSPAEVAELRERYLEP